MDTTGAKVICLFSLLTDCFLFGFIPRVIIPPARKPGQSLEDYVAARRWYHVSRKYREISVSMVGTFAGGVFLATCLLDLLVDVTGDYQEFFDKAGIDVNFPMAQFTACVGFFLILLIEQMVLFVKELNQPRIGRNDSLESLGASVLSISISGPDPEVPGSPLVSNGKKRKSTLGSMSGIYTSQNAGTNAESIDTNSLSHDHEVEDKFKPSKVRAAILLTALSVHSVFEGLALGLEDSGSKVLELFSGLIIHKSVVAFNLGMSVVKSNMSMKETVGSIMGFSIASPTGIAIGIAVSQQEGLFTLGLSTVLQGLATGTFLYITFFEVLPLEFNCRRWRLQKVVSVILGFSVMCFMILYSGD